MKSKLLSLSAVALMLGGIPPAFADADDVTAWRLFVSDHDKPVINVIDPKTAKNVKAFTVHSPAALYRTDSGRAIFATQAESGDVSVLSSGISFHDHGDHGDIDVDPPKLLDLDYKGGTPGHFTEQHGQIMQWFDKESHSIALTEQDVLRQKKDAASIDVQAPHHGVGVSFGNYAVVTVPGSDEKRRPSGVRIVTREGKQLGAEIPCPGTHGEAGSGDIFALSCKTGIMLIKQQGQEAPVITSLPYPSTLPEGRSTQLVGGHGLQYFMGNYGQDRIVLIDPTQADSFRLIQLPTRRVHFAVDPIRAKFAYVITEDGQLHQIDVIKGSISKSLRVTEPYSMEGHWNDPRPRIAVADDRIYVTDPLNSQIHVISATEFRELDHIHVDGKPFNIVAVGGTGKSHKH